MNLILALACAGLLAACAGEVESSEEPSNEEEASAPPVGDAQVEAAATEPIVPSPAIPSEYTRTAWRVIGEDGARYVTYLDEDGRYRDLRNGEPYQEGEWEFGVDDRLCFTPDDEAALGECWEPERMSLDDELIMESDDGQRIQLSKITYRPPEVDDKPSDTPS